MESRAIRRVDKDKVATASMDVRGENCFSVLKQTLTTPSILEEVVKAGWDLQQRPKKVAIYRSGFNLDEIQNLMVDHIETHINLETLASCACLSKFHFVNKYKQLTGYPPIKHFIYMKMDYACCLLHNTSKQVGEIAEQLGYDDRFYFSRIFRKTVGLSPIDYRKFLFVN